MTETFEKDTPDFSDPNKDFDIYGVWIKQKPKTQDSEILEFENNDDVEINTIVEEQPLELTTDEIKTEFSDFENNDFTEIKVNDEINLESNTSIKEGDITRDMETDEFETFELDDFLSDDTPLADDSTNATKNPESKTNENKENLKISDFESADFDVDDLLPPDDSKKDDEVEPVKLDIEFDDTFADEKSNEASSLDSFDDMLDELTGTTAPAKEPNPISEVKKDEFETIDDKSDEIADLNTEIDVPDFSSDDLEMSASNTKTISFEELTGDVPQEQERSNSQSENTGFEEISLDDFVIDDSNENTVDNTSETLTSNKKKTMFSEDIDLEINLDDKSDVGSIQEVVKTTSDEISNVALFEDDAPVETDEPESVDTPVDNATIDIADLASELNISIEETSSDDLYFDDVNAVTDDLLNTNTSNNTENVIAQEDASYESIVSEDVLITTDEEIPMNNDDDTTAKESTDMISEEISENIVDEKMTMPSFDESTDNVSTDMISEETSENVVDEEMTMPSFDENTEGESTDMISEEISENIVEEKVQSQDKSTELLMQIAGEIASIKTELSDLKRELKAHVTDSSDIYSPTDDIADNNVIEDVIYDNFETEQDSNSEISDDIEVINNDKSEEATGFFTDDDTDETIALTGDELSNILITADFTEESVSEDYEIPEVLNLDDIYEAPTVDSDMPDESISELDGITIEPEHITPQPEDMSYLDNEDIINDEIDFDTTTIEIPSFDDESSTENSLVNSESEDAKLSLSELDDISNDIPVLDLDVNNVDQDFAETAEEKLSMVNHKEIHDNITQQSNPLPIELKEEIKSVLSYMDQLLESLPEEKIEEFAKSDHFTTYKKLFEDLGIS